VKVRARPKIGDNTWVSNTGRAGKGRPKGAKNKRTREILELVDNLLDEDYFAALKVRLREGEAQAVEKYLFEMGWGKPKARVEMSGGLDLTQARATLSEKLAQMAARLKAQREGEK